MAKNTTLTEYEEAKVFAQYLDLKRLLFTHIAQETFTKNWGTKMKNKMMGVRKGFPDYAIIANKQLLFVELKRKKGGKVSPEQKKWIEELNGIIGVVAIVANGADEAIKFVEDHLD